MEQLIINIENPSVLPTLRKMLEKVEGISVFQKKRNKVEVTEEEPCMTKEEILEGFDHACKELKLYREGKIKLKTLEEVIDEL